MLQDRIQKINPYFKGIEISGGLIIVKVEFPHGWKAYPTQDEETIKVALSEQEANVWFYYSDCTKVDLEMVFDLIEETIEFNESLIRKVELLKTKVEELKLIFNDEPLSRLETLYFAFTEKPVTKKKSRKTTKKVKPQVEEEMEMTPVEEEVFLEDNAY